MSEKHPILMVTLPSGEAVTNAKKRKREAIIELVEEHILRAYEKHPSEVRRARTVSELCRIPGFVLRVGKGLPWSYPMVLEALRNVQKQLLESASDKKRRIRL